MAITTVPVTCLAYDQNGNAVSNGQYTAVLTKTEVQNGFIVPEMVNSIANAEGVAVINLWPNALGTKGSTYRVTGSNPDTNAIFFNAEVYVPNNACNLHEIVVASPSTPLNDAQSALVATQQALAEITTGGYMKMEADTIVSSDVLVKSATGQELLRFTNTNTVENPVYALVASILPRTGTLSALSALTSGGGELASATDTPAIVQLNGTYPGTAVVYSPMATGIWDDVTFTLKAKNSVGTTAAKDLTISGGNGISGSTDRAGSLVLRGGASSVGKTGLVKLGSQDFDPSIANSSSGDVTINTGSKAAGSGNAVGTSKCGDLYLAAGNGSAIGGSVFISSGLGNQTNGNINLFSDGVITMGEDAISISNSGTSLLLGQPTTFSSQIGFYGTTPKSKQVVSGSRGSNAALTSLLTALATLGIITNSSTA